MLLLTTARLNKTRSTMANWSLTKLRQDIMTHCELLQSNFTKIFQSDTSPLRMNGWRIMICEVRYFDKNTLSFVSVSHPSKVCFEQGKRYCTRFFSFLVYNVIDTRNPGIYIYCVSREVGVGRWQNICKFGFLWLTSCNYKVNLITSSLFENIKTILNILQTTYIKY